VSPLGTIKVVQEFQGSSTNEQSMPKKNKSSTRIPPVIMDPPLEKGPLSDLFWNKDLPTLGIEVRPVQTSPLRPSETSMWDKVDPFNYDTSLSNNMETNRNSTHEQHRFSRNTYVDPHHFDNNKFGSRAFSLVDEKKVTECVIE
jgi:hypothetical protein